jgi:hypothetical protein
LIAAGAVIALAVPASAQALDFCVNRAGCDPSRTFGENQLQDAITAAGVAANGDRILVGSGVYDDGPYSAAAGNQIDLIGAGPNATTLRKGPAGNDQTILTVPNVASTVQDLGIELTNGNNLTGLSVRNSATRVRVVQTATATGEPTGIQFTGAGALVDSSVSLDVATLNTAVSAMLPGETAELTLQNNDLSAARGVSYQTPIHTERNRITARVLGIGGVGPLTIDNASVRMVGGGGPNIAAVNVSSSQLGAPASAGDLDAQHLTAFGPGAGAGVVISSGCQMTGANVFPVAASGVVRDSVVDGFQFDLTLAGRTCFDPVIPTTTNSYVSLNIDYSLYDPATVRQFAPASFSPGSHNLNTDPQFVDPAAGNLRLRQGSPAIDAGQPTPAAGNERDVEGNPRVQDGNGDGTAVRDMGAYEHTFVPSGDPGDGGNGGDGGDGGGQLTRTLSLGYSAKSDKFKGRLRSNEPGCLAGKVKVYEKAKGKDPKAGSDKTNAAGKWSFEEKNADGKFYGLVAEKTVPTGTCPAARSRAKRVG